MVLETFYMVSKINSVKKEYNKINDMYNNNESSILLKIRNDALANNFDIMVENEDYMLVFSTNENFSNMISQNLENNRLKLFGKRERVLYSNNNMEIKKVISDKKEFLELLLLADEQESMIDRYLERGDMFVLYDNGLKALCVVTREGEGIYEIKNIATVPFFQRQGYGKCLIEFLFEYYQGKCSEMLVGTGDVPSSRSFYEHCGFTVSHRIKNFFTDNYDHPMYEDGVQLVDMIYLKKTF